MVSANRQAPFFFLGAENIAGSSTTSRAVARQLKVKATGLTAESRTNCFSLIFLSRARAHPLVFLLHFYIFSFNGVTDCSLMYVERAFIYIVPHYFYIFSVSCFAPLCFFPCSSAFTEKRAKETKFAREENFCAREEKKFAREKKMCERVVFPAKNAGGRKKSSIFAS